MTDSTGICQGHELFQMNELLGLSPWEKNYPPGTARLITYFHLQHSFPSFILHTTVKHGLVKLLGLTWWLLLVRLSKMKIPPIHLGLIALWLYFLEVFWCYSWVTSCKFRPGYRNISSPLLIIHSICWHINLGNIHCILHQSLHGQTQ